jgi:hypothetical protein
MSKKQVQLPIAVVNAPLAIWVQQELDEETLQEVIEELSGEVRFNFRLRSEMPPAEE